MFPVRLLMSDGETTVDIHVPQPPGEYFSIGRFAPAGPCDEYRLEPAYFHSKRTFEDGLPFYAEVQMSEDEAETFGCKLEWPVRLILTLDEV